MANAPTPILVIHRRGGTTQDPFRALALGALDVAERPDVPAADYWRTLGPRLALLSQVRVVQHVKGKRRKPREENRLSGPAQFPMVAVASSLGGPRAIASVLRMLPKAFGAPIC